MLMLNVKLKDALRGFSIINLSHYFSSLPLMSSGHHCNSLGQQQNTGKTLMCRAFIYKKIDMFENDINYIHSP